MAERVSNMKKSILFFTVTALISGISSGMVVVGGGGHASFGGGHAIIAPHVSPPAPRVISIVPRIAPSESISVSRPPLIIPTGNFSRPSLKKDEERKYSRKQMAIAGIAGAALGSVATKAFESPSPQAQVIQHEPVVSALNGTGNYSTPQSAQSNFWSLVAASFIGAAIFIAFLVALIMLT